VKLGNQKMELERMSSANQAKVSHKLVYLVIAVLCFMVGLVGLIIPVIPGVLFFLGGIFYLSKVSTRFKYWSEQQPILQKLESKLARLKTVDYRARAKVVGLMTIDMMIKSTTSTINMIKRRI